MAKIWIEPSKAKGVLNLEDSLEKALNSMSNEVDGIRSGLRQKIAGQEQIAARLKDAVNQLKKEATATGAMRLGLEQIIAQYERTENGNRDRAVPDKASIQQSGGAGESSQAAPEIDWEQLKKTLAELIGPQGFLGPTITIGPFIPWILDTVKPIFENDGVADNPFFKLEGEIDNKHEGEWEIKSFDKKKDPINGGSQKLYYRDLETGQITTVDPNDQTAMAEFKKHNKGSIPVDVTLAGIGVSGSAAIFDNDFGGTYDWGGHEGNVSFGKIEGTADAYLGWGAIGAEVGASISAFSAKEKGYLGTEDANIYGEVGVDVGRAEAKAGVSAGIVDKSGSINPSLYAGASAEAIAGEITGKAGVDIGGVDVGVEGSLNYGIGAHANVGLHDGKLSVDIGATLGVGASVKLEVDVSGAVDALAGTADAIWSGVTNLFTW